MSGENNKNSKLNQQGDFVPVYETLAILDETESTPVTNISLPSAEAVKDAKDWVDHNEK